MHSPPTRTSLICCRLAYARAMFVFRRALGVIVRYTVVWVLFCRVDVVVLLVFLSRRWCCCPTIDTHCGCWCPTIDAYCGCCYPTIDVLRWMLLSYCLLILSYCWCCCSTAGGVALLPLVLLSFCWRCWTASYCCRWCCCWIQ